MHNLSIQQETQKALFEEVLQNRIFNDLKPQITEKLIYLLENGKNLYEGFENVGALNFEIDSRLEMQYIGYPFYLFDHSWGDSYKIDVRDKNKYSVYDQLITDFIKEQNISTQEIDLYLINSTYDVELRNFSHCWIEAKKVTQSDKLCYINIHDSRGFCCDTAQPMQETVFESLVNKTFRL